MEAKLILNMEAYVHKQLLISILFSDCFAQYKWGPLILIPGGQPHWLTNQFSIRNLL